MSTVQIVEYMNKIVGDCPMNSNHPEFVCLKPVSFIGRCENTHTQESNKEEGEASAEL